MKNLIGNILIFLLGTIINFFALIWYGKLPKVSIWHQWNRGGKFDWWDIFNDAGIQSRTCNSEADKITNNNQ